MVAAGLALTAAALVPLPRHPVTDPLSDIVHAPLFAAFAWWWCRRDARPASFPRVAGALALSALVGGLVEVAQGQTGRQASARDVGSDVLGAVAGCALALARERAGATRGSFAAVGILALVLSWWTPVGTLVDRGRQWRALPLLASFEDDSELGRWACEGCEAARDARHATDGRSSLRVRFEPGPYPGVGLVSLLGDWTAYRGLRFDLYVEGSDPVPLRVKIEDGAHDGTPTDCFQRTLDLAPGAHRVEVDLADVAKGPRGRRLDLARVKLFKVFAVGPRAARTVYLDDLRLVAGGP
jgi:hypothetical protein